MIVTPPFNFDNQTPNIKNCSKSNLDTFANSATFSGLALSDFDAKQMAVHKDTSVPSNPNIGQVSINTSPTDYFSVLYWNGSGWAHIANGS